MSSLAPRLYAAPSVYTPCRQAMQFAPLRGRIEWAAVLTRGSGSRGFTSSGLRHEAQQGVATDSPVDAGVSVPPILAQAIAKSIKASGPLSVSSFMSACLQDQNAGYYTSAHVQDAAAASARSAAGRDVLGARGDFITSPEISQVFGELCAIFFIARWQSVEPSAPTRLVELGPGKGTLLADMIRTFATFKSFFKSFKEIHLVETSPGLRQMQLDTIRDALAKAGKRVSEDAERELEEDEVRLSFFDSVGQVQVQPHTWSMVIAHEFLDALPARVFQRTSDGFREVMVDLEGEKKGQSGVTVLKPGDLIGNSPKPKSIAGDDNPKFRYALSPKATPWSVLLADRNPRFRGVQPGQRVEVSFDAWATARRIGELVAGRPAKAGQVDDESAQDRESRERKELQRQAGSSQGGAGLVVDYGDDMAVGSSFRAFKAHKIVDPLEAPGTADLTVNVDFGYVKNAVQSTDGRNAGLLPQAHFLQALGLRQRVEGLMAKAADEERKRVIEQAAERLIDMNGMGVQYKVLGICAEARESAEADKADMRVPCYPFEE